MTLNRVGVVGTGLIGTSIGLALARRGTTVQLLDRAPGRAAAAAALGAGREVLEVADLGECDHVVVATPPESTVAVVHELLRRTVRPTISDVSSVKANVVAEIETLDLDTSRFCSGHPIAGRERGGPGAAQPELFDGAVWAVVPTGRTAEHAATDLAELAVRCGARVVRLSAAEHDAVLAAISHLPQLAASALAAELPTLGALAPALAGPGFRDTTRLAESDPALWTEIARANAGPVAAALRRLSARLVAVADGLAEGSANPVTELLAAGNRGRALLPGKVNAARRAWRRVGVVLADQPGELARLLVAIGAAGVNVEDLEIEHAPDHPVGYVDLSVAPESVDRLITTATQAGFAAHPID